MITREYLSYSAMNCYRSCPLKYYFRYIAKIPDQTRSESLIFGSAIHRALEYLHKAMLAGESLPSREQFLSWFRDEWLALRADPKPEVAATTSVTHGDGEQFANQADHLAMARAESQASQLFEAFLATPLPYSRNHLVLCEDEFMAKIDEDSPPLFGRLDLLGLDHSAQDLVLVDFKTSKQRWSDEDIQRNGDQLRLTSLALKDSMGLDVSKCLFIVLVKTKLPAIQVLEFDPSPAQAERARQTFARVWKAIEQENFYPSPSAMNCSYCAYHTQCQQWPNLPVIG